MTRLLRSPSNSSNFGLTRLPSTLNRCATRNNLTIYLQSDALLDCVDPLSGSFVADQTNTPPGRTACAGMGASGGSSTTCQSVSCDDEDGSRPVSGSWAPRSSSSRLSEISVKVLSSRINGEVSSAPKFSG